MHDRGAAEQPASFGLWIYLMGDCILFASLLAVYAVLSGAAAGGPGPKELFNPPFVLAETFVLLTSSLCAGFSVLAGARGQARLAMRWLYGTALLGTGFLTMEAFEFIKLISEGAGPGRSAFLSALFALLGVHGLHVLVGLIFLAVLARMLNGGMTPLRQRRLADFALFWHFLDLIWIFIFSLVYLRGIAS